MMATSQGGTPSLNFSFTITIMDIKWSAVACKDRMKMITYIIIHQTHYEKSDWSRAFNQFTIACELDMINVISAADITFIMSSSTSAWLLSPLECSRQKQNGWTLRFCFWGWIMRKMYNKTIIYWIRFLHDIMNYQNLVSVLSASAFGFGR